MSFNYDNFGRILTNKSADLVSGYSYVSSDDSLGTIVADAYFNDLIDNKNILVVGDILFLIGSDKSGMYEITSVTTDVTVSDYLNTTNVVAADPAVTDDVMKGYSVGSHWVSSVDSGIFICTDATAGAAVWAEVTTV